MTPEQITRCIQLNQAYKHEVYRKKHQNGISRKQAAGELLGPAPLGYRNCRDSQHTWVEIDSTKAPLVRILFELAADFSGSLTKLTQRMVHLGMTNRYGLPISRHQVRSILQNPFYTGKIVYGGHMTHGSHEPLISDECFAKVQQHLASRQRTLSAWQSKVGKQPQI